MIVPVTAIMAFHIARAAPPVMTAMIPVSVPVTVAAAAVIVVVIKSADNEGASPDRKTCAYRIDVALRVRTSGRAERYSEYGNFQ